MDTIVEIQRWFVEHSSVQDLSLNTGADNDELAILEKTFPQLGEDFKEVYKISNGQNRRSTVNMFPGFRLLSLAEIKNEISQWEVLSNEEQEIGINSEEDYVSYPNDSIRKVYYSSLWLPFAIDGGGNFIAVDYDPEQSGTVGQIIVAGSDIAKRYVLSKSLKELLISIRNHLVSGDASYDKNEGNVLWGRDKLFHIYDILNIYGAGYFMQQPNIKTR